MNFKIQIKLAMYHEFKDFLKLFISNSIDIGIIFSLLYINYSLFEWIFINLLAFSNIIFIFKN